MESDEDRNDPVGDLPNETVYRPKIVLTKKPERRGAAAPWTRSIPTSPPAARLIAVPLDLRKEGAGHIRRTARAEATEIAELLDHDISAHWTSGADVVDRPISLRRRSSRRYASDDMPRPDMKAEELADDVASVAAEKG